jgi:hypothetical protein
VSTKLVAALVLTMIVQGAYADDGTCDMAGRRAEAHPTLLVPRVYFAVTSGPRLFFYSAPDQACRQADTFVIAGDSLIGYSEFKGWISVMFAKPNGDPVMGWVRSERLRATGTLGGQ